MRSSIVNLLEAIKHQPNFEISDFLNRNDIEYIQNWYNKFSNEKNADNIKIVDLLYYLYVHENIDLYTVEHFQQTVKYLSETYSFEESLFLDLVQSYRELIFGQND